MSCPFCGNAMNPGATECPRCGGRVAPPQPAAGQVVASPVPPTNPPNVTASPAPAAPTAGYGQDLGNASSPFSAGASGPVATQGDRQGGTPTAPGGSGGIFTSAQPEAEAEADAEATLPEPEPATQDPEAGLRTAIVSIQDRQEVLETKIVEAPQAPPKTDIPALETEEKKGLPDSRVARGVEDTFLGVRRFLLRLGRVGRVAFFAHVAVIVGAVCPWYFVPHFGYTPGVEGWGMLPLALSAASIGMLAWRYRTAPKAKTLPVAGHLVLSAGLVLALAWIYQTAVNLPDHLEPNFAFGLYISAGGTAVALVASLLGLKDIR